MANIGIITQARMTSTRLPGKILKEINNKPLIKYHLDRLRWSNVPVFIATTTNGTDDPVAEFSKKENVPFYRGSEDNVLSRFYHTAKTYNLDLIVRVTSDCPLIDGNMIRKGIDEYIQSGKNNLYLSNCIERTYPRGFDFEIFSFSLLENAFLNATITSDLEHVTPYINQNKSGKVDFYSQADIENNNDIRITVDTPEDFLLIRKLIEDYQADQLKASEIISLFRKFPELKKINEHIEQKKI